MRGHMFVRSAAPAVTLKALGLGSPHLLPAHRGRAFRETKEKGTESLLGRSQNRRWRHGLMQITQDKMWQSILTGTQFSSLLLENKTHSIFGT